MADNPTSLTTVEPATPVQQHQHRQQHQHQHQQPQPQPQPYNAFPSRESSDSNSPPSAGQQRKRKYEEATEDEKLALNEYHIAHPSLKQRELAEWFRVKYGKSINQSTVSRNLKKFKASPPSKEPGFGHPESSPIKRNKKSSKTRSPQKKIQITQQLPSAPSAVSLPPTPPPRDNRSSPIDSTLYEFYLKFRNLHPEASAADCDREIKQEARRLIAAVRPLPPPEKIDEPVIDDAWVLSWKRIHGVPAPHSASDCLGALETTAAVNTAGADRSSEDTEPRSPVSTVSSSDHRRSLELPPIKSEISGSPENLQLPATNQLHGGTNESLERLRRKEIEDLRRDIEKRDQRIKHELRKKESAMRRLERLEKAGIQ